MEKARVREYYDQDYYDQRKGALWLKLPFSGGGYYLDPLVRLQVRPGGRLLDIACGEGQLLARAQGMGLHCFGIDLSQVALDRARLQCNAALVCADVDGGLPYEDAFFDYVTCLGSLEHFTNQSFVVSQIRRVLRPTGGVYILVPNQDYFLHKIGYETDFQPVVNRLSLCGYTRLLGNAGLPVERVFRDNAHLANLRESSSLFKLALKIAVHPFLPLIPLRLSYNFGILCRPTHEAGT